MVDIDAIGFSKIILLITQASDPPVLTVQPGHLAQNYSKEFRK